MVHTWGHTLSHVYDLLPFVCLNSRNHSHNHTFTYTFSVLRDTYSRLCNCSQNSRQAPTQSQIYNAVVKRFCSKYDSPTRMWWSGETETLPSPFSESSHVPHIHPFSMWSERPQITVQPHLPKDKDQRANCARWAPWRNGNISQFHISSIPVMIFIYLFLQWNGQGFWVKSMCWQHFRLGTRSLRACWQTLDSSIYEDLWWGHYDIIQLIITPFS